MKAVAMVLYADARAAGLAFAEARAAETRSLISCAFVILVLPCCY